MKRGDLQMLALLSLGVWVLSRRRVVWGPGWQWPVANVNVRGRLYNPFITHEFEAGHTGVDIEFPRRTKADLVDLYPPGTPNGGASWFSPPGTPILAARPGVVWLCQKAAKGWEVVISHGKPWASCYRHIEAPAVPPHRDGKNLITGADGQHVDAGTVLGTMGYSPEDPERVRHLHFEVWYEGGADHAVDPQQAMRQWPYATSVYNVT